MPHTAFEGQSPNEVFFGTGDAILMTLASDRAQAQTCTNVRPWGLYPLSTFFASAMLMRALVPCFSSSDRRFDPFSSVIGFVDRDGRPVKFEPSISIATAIDQAYQKNRLLLETEPSHRVSKQYRDLAREVEKGILRHRKGKEKRGTAAMELDEPRIQEEMVAHG